MSPSTPLRFDGRGVIKQQCFMSARFMEILKIVTRKDDKALKELSLLLNILRRK